MIRKIEYILKHNSIIRKLYINVFSSFFILIGLFIKTNKKQVLFQSLIGNNYGDSPKAIFDAMKKDPFFNEYEYIWAFQNPESFNIEGAIKVKMNSLSYFISAIKSGIWITNVNIERGLRFKPKNTVYLNTWHGCAPLKVDGNAQKNRNDYNFSNIDIFCSNSEWWDECFKTYFNVRQESLLRCGLPRNDNLFDTNQQDVDSLRSKYNIPIGKKVLLYTPTWRESSDRGESSIIKPPISIKYWQEKLSNEYVVLFRMHHLTTKVMNIEFNSFVRDYSGSYDVNELMKMADILITDYSSILADFAILGRPVLFFAYDYKDYYQNRGLYIKLEDILPGCVCETENELIDHIMNIDYKAECEKVSNLLDKFVYNNNDSTQKCLNALKEKLK